MRKNNYDRYPTVSEIKKFFKLDAGYQLRWAKDYHKKKSDSLVKVYIHDKNNAIFNFRKLNQSKFVYLQTSIIAWVLTHNSFPSALGIFSPTGNNNDLNPDNWKENQSYLPIVTGENIKKYIDYDGKTGLFTWKYRDPLNENDRTINQKNANKPVKESLHDGYLTFKIYQCSKKSHQWAWIYTYGELPKNGLVIDHINRNKKDNRIANLRAVTVAENNKNIDGYALPVKTKPTPVKRPYLKQNYVKERLVYNYEIGEFTWKERKGTSKECKLFNTRWAGERAGKYSKINDKYAQHLPVIIKFDSVGYLAQEVLWAYLGHPHPITGLHCINGNKQDLRVANWIDFELNDKKDSFKSETAPVVKQAILHSLVDYNPSTGVFTYKQRNNITKANMIFNTRAQKNLDAGYIGSAGRYRKVTIQGIDYNASHLAWLYVFGEWPPDTDFVIDHINNDSLDDRISNLRAVSQAENCRNRTKLKNNKSGYTGVIQDSQKKRKWRAYITVNKKKITLGIFNLKKQAISARHQAEKKYGFI